MNTSDAAADGHHTSHSHWLALQHLSLRFPVNHQIWTNFNGLQQLIYFIIVFIAAPLAVVTGLMHGPAFSNNLRETSSTESGPL